MKHGTVLRTKLILAKRLAAQRNVGPTAVDVDAILPEWLFSTYCVAQASAPLMRAALGRCEALGPNDPVAWGLRGYLREHIDEEQEHAVWVLEDLAALGAARSEVLARIPTPAIAALVGAQYYYIQHDHPVSLLGYIAVLEASLAPIETVRAMMANSRLPASAFRTLVEHAELDPLHSRQLFELLDTLPLTTRHNALLGTNAFATLELLDRAVRALLSGERSPVAALSAAR